MKYFQQTELIIQFIHKLNLCNNNTTFYIYIVVTSRNAHEFDIFSKELSKKLTTCRFYALSRENRSDFSIGSNHYSCLTLQKPRIAKVTPKNSEVHLSLPISTIIPQCPKCQSTIHLRKKIVLLNPATDEERVGAMFNGLSSNHVAETELTGYNQQFAKGKFCTKCNIAFIADRQLNRYTGEN